MYTFIRIWIRVYADDIDSYCATLYYMYITSSRIWLQYTFNEFRFVRHIFTIKLLTIQTFKEIYTWNIMLGFIQVQKSNQFWRTFRSSCEFDNLSWAVDLVRKSEHYVTWRHNGVAATVRSRYNTTRSPRIFTTGSGQVVGESFVSSNLIHVVLSSLRAICYHIGPTGPCYNETRLFPENKEIWVSPFYKYSFVRTDGKSIEC